MPIYQPSLPFGPIRNQSLFSNHWLDNRLTLEPDWNTYRKEAEDAFQQLVKLWEKEKNLVELYDDEQGLEEKFIQPVLEALGWEFKYQTFLQGRAPDYALFLDHGKLTQAVKAGRNEPEFWDYPTVVADAKAWHIKLDRRTVANNKREYPPEQMEWYLDHSRVDYGILTNGQTWRLIPREYGPQQRRFETYLECNLASILAAWLNAKTIIDQSEVIDDFERFYLFFSPTAFSEINHRKPFIVRALEGSSEYRVGVGEGLRERTFQALGLCIEGFLSHQSNKLDPTNDLALCREQSFILLFRLLFIMFAEDRHLLPYHVNRTYTTNRSLGRLRDEIAAGFTNQVGIGYSKDSIGLWDTLKDLFDLVDRGHKAYGVPAYNGGLFDPETHPFLAEKQIPDSYLSQVIDKLGRAPDPKLSLDQLFRVDYHDLAIQHLGGIYEGLLELHPHCATERMIVISHKEKGKTVEKPIPATAAIPDGWTQTEVQYRPGNVYLLTDKGERRASGSYYTPDPIVNYIVEKTLGPICLSISVHLQKEIHDTQTKLTKAKNGERKDLAALLLKLQNDFDDRVLRLRVLDPAIGSGHFLLRACQYLAEEIATHPNTGDETANAKIGEEPTLNFWKRRVVEQCLYGVDVNGLAVELAKLALWLETISNSQPLSFLDHHLKHGNSLIGAHVAELGVLPGNHVLLSNTFAGEVEKFMPTLLKPLAEIRNIPSDTADQVRTKDKLYASFMKAREPFRLTADLWCSTFAEKNASMQDRLSAERYQQALDTLKTPIKFKAVAEEPWFKIACQHLIEFGMNPFHWELEFPEVYFEGTARSDKPGFDAVIGNPPYDVLSELETGNDLTAFRAIVDHEPIYAPSKGGKNNLYKLFVCRALSVLADDGRLGFITPMPLLGDEQAASLRREMLKVGTFEAIEAFPQKDDARQRVFPEAKLSTSIFILRKGLTNQAIPFLSRIHPGNEIKDDSPSLKLTTSEVPLYDPSNFTIISCSQSDWDLASRMMACGRMMRLDRICTSFQGEVNETNEKKRGSISKTSGCGQLVLRGSNVCLYSIREASQGEDYYLDVELFMEGKEPGSKAYHSREARIGFQRSSPQNNFRRIVAAPINPNSYCFDTISYVPLSQSSVPLSFVLALLNSKLLDWYFRLGSTNSKVNEYQFKNMPCPVFADTPDVSLETHALKALRLSQFDKVQELLSSSIETPPFKVVIRNVIVAAVERIINLETERGEIARSDRSALTPAAQPYQDLIDQLLYRMAGLSPEEAKGLEERLEKML